VTDLGLPSINADDESITAAIDCLPKQDKEDNRNNAISFMRLRIRGSLSAPRAAQGYNGGYSPLAAKLVESQSVKYITVAQISHEYLAFADNF
jgi:hypothetical protein